MPITIQHLASHAVTPADDAEIAGLQHRCFPDAHPDASDARSYFKQLPHARFIARNEHGQLLAHLGLDHRVIRVGDRVIPILGLIALCVDKPARRQGLATRLLHEAEQLARQAPAQIEFLLLITDIPAFYQPHGFHQVPPTDTRFLAIDERRIHSVIQHLEHELMAKPLSNQPWPDGPIDLLGYLF
ncbi:MAG: GNAT family N-acetyltransferase [Planctomycetota bacterium]